MVPYIQRMLSGRIHTILSDTTYPVIRQMCPNTCRTNHMNQGHFIGHCLNPVNLHATAPCHPILIPNLSAFCLWASIFFIICEWTDPNVHVFRMLLLAILLSLICEICCFYHCFVNNLKAFLCAFHWFWSTPSCVFVCPTSRTFVQSVKLWPWV